MGTLAMALTARWCGFSGFSTWISTVLFFETRNDVRRIILYTSLYCTSLHIFTHLYTSLHIFTHLYASLYIFIHLYTFVCFRGCCVVIRITRIYYGLLKCAWDTSLPQTSRHMEDPFQSSIPELSANPRHQKSFGQGGSGLVSKRLLQQLFLPRFNALFVTLWDAALRRESMWWTSTKTSRLRPQNCTPCFILRRNGRILLETTIEVGSHDFLQGK